MPPRFKMYGGGIWSDYKFWIIGAIVIIIALSLGLGLGLGLKSPPPPGNSQPLAISLNGTPYGCNKGQLGCTPTGATLSVTPSDPAAAKNGTIFWTATGFDNSNKLIKGTSSQAVNANSPVTSIIANLGTPISKIQYTVYLTNGDASGPAVYYSFP